MDFPSSSKGHALKVDEFNTTTFLAHARRQADERGFDDFRIASMSILTSTKGRRAWSPSPL